MNIKSQIKEYITGISEPKRSEMQALHSRILKINAGCKFWLPDGKDDIGKIDFNLNKQNI